MSKIPKELKKEVIKEIISPTLKCMGFKKKGTFYSKIIYNLIIDIRLQSQRYYKEENIENFRINIKVYPSFITEKELCENAYFDNNSIQENNSSWIQITCDKNIEQFKIWLSDELNKKCKIFLSDSYKIFVKNKVLKEKENLLQKIILKKDDLKKLKSTQENMISILKNTILLYEQKIEWIDKWLEMEKLT